jgi:hypothetical protein
MEKQNIRLIFQILSSSFSFLFFVSCSGGGGTNASASRNTAPPNSEASDPSLLLEPEGTYNQTLALPNPYYGHFQNGCTSPGNSTPVRQVDTRLSIGMSYEISYRSIQPTTQLMRTTVQGNVLLRTGSSISMNGTVNAASNINGLSAGVSSIRTCVFDSGTGEFPCVFTPMPAVSMNPGSHIECKIQNGTQTSWSISSGTFTTLKGQTVPAYKILATYTGNVECDGNNLGPGTAYYKLILSNKVPSEGQVNFCGGVRIFDGSSFYLNNGTHALTMSFEKLKVPVLP